MCMFIDILRQSNTSTRTHAHVHDTDRGCMCSIFDCICLPISCIDTGGRNSSSSTEAREGSVCTSSPCTHICLPRTTYPHYTCLCPNSDSATTYTLDSTAARCLTSKPDPTRPPSPSSANDTDRGLAAYNSTAEKLWNGPIVTSSISVVGIIVGVVVFVVLAVALLVSCTNNDVSPHPPHPPPPPSTPYPPWS